LTGESGSQPLDPPLIIVPPPKEQQQTSLQSPVPVRVGNLGEKGSQGVE
jgi:hypothetical protein